MKNPLNGRQKRFADEYLVDLNATQAAIRAGYSEKTAYSQGQRLLKNVEIEKMIQSEMDKRAERTEITADYVLNTIVQTIERCKQTVPVKQANGDPVLCTNESGEAVPVCKFSPSAVLRGCELLGKHLKLFTDKREVEGRLTLEELVTGEIRTLDKTSEK